VTHTHSSASDSELDAFFNGAIERFNEIRRCIDSSTKRVELAGRKIEIIVAGEALSHVMRPLNCETASNRSSPELTICAWEGSGPEQAPTLPWHPSAQADSIGLKTSRFHMNYHAPSGLLCMWDQQTGQAIYWIEKVCDLPYWEIASPCRILFHWWAQSWGAQLAHAAAVGVDGRGLLLVGKSGSGKSTTSLACIRQGMEFIGDDYVLLTAGLVPTAHRLYSSAKLHADTLARYFPEWKSFVAARVGPQRKCVVYVDDLRGLNVESNLEVHAVVMPVVTGDAYPTLSPTAVSQTWLALVPSTMFQLPDSRETSLAFFSTFTRRLPSYRLSTGRDVQLIPEAIRTFLKTQLPHDWQKSEVKDV